MSQSVINLINSANSSEIIATSGWVSIKTPSGVIEVTPEENNPERCFVSGAGFCGNIATKNITQQGIAEYFSKY